jgi:hypothetical protein
LDDALSKLARRDELRRRATSEATGTPAAVTELVEAIAAVVARNPRLGVTVGVEGDGDPMVLRFYYEDGQVQVAADNPLTAQPTDGGPRHADFDVVVGEPVEEVPPPTYPGGETQRLRQDNQDRYGPTGYAYEQPADYYAEPDTAERRYGNFDGPPPPRDPGEDSRDLGARMRDLGMASSGRNSQPPVRDPQSFARDAQPPVRDPQSFGRDSQQPEYPPHPLAPTPPPPIPAQATRRIEPEQYRAPAEPPASERMHPDWADATTRLVPPPPVESRGMPTPLPQPIPLQVERPEETEMAARRLAALLRDDPSLLNQRPD